MLDYNLGNPTGNPATLGDGAPPSIPLVAVYPSDGTLVSDNPWLVLDADWVTDADRRAGGQFLTWLHEPDQQAAFTAAGFRTFEGTPGEVITPANGMLAAGAKAVLDPPAPKVLAEVQKSWAELRKRAHVLFVMDVSGSMGETVTASGQSKLQLAQAAASDAFDGFAADDEVGLWAFSTDRGPSGEPWVKLQPVAPAATAVPPMKRDVAAMVADGGTALYATLREAQREVPRRPRPEADQRDRPALRRQERVPAGHRPRQPARAAQRRECRHERGVFTIGYGEGADPAALTAIAQASRGTYYEANDPTSIEKVLASVLSNF